MAALLELAAKYEVSAIANYIPVVCGPSGTLISQYYVTSLDLVTPQYAYVLGADFGVRLLKTANRHYIVIHFQKRVQSIYGPQEWNMLLKWTEPTKVYELVRDATKRKTKFSRPSFTSPT